MLRRSEKNNARGLSEEKHSRRKCPLRQDHHTACARKSIAATQNGQVGLSSPSTRRENLKPRLTLPKEIQLVTATLVTFTFIVATSLTKSNVRKCTVHHGREPWQWRHEAASSYIHGQVGTGLYSLQGPLLPFRPPPPKGPASSHNRTNS